MTVEKFKQTYRQVGPTPERLAKLRELGYEPVDAGAETYRT